VTNATVASLDRRVIPVERNMLQPIKASNTTWHKARHCGKVSSNSNQWCRSTLHSQEFQTHGTGAMLYAR